MLTSYQGLGTSSDDDARNYFSDMRKHMIPFTPTQEGDKELIELAFSKKKADERKEWLRQFKVRYWFSLVTIDILLTVSSLVAWHLP